MNREDAKDAKDIGGKVDLYFKIALYLIPYLKIFARFAPSR